MEDLADSSSDSETPMSPKISTTSPSAILNNPPTCKVDYKKLDEFKFDPPQDCPIFRPTEEEFARGPLEYIQKIRQQAEKFGICKIVPPKSFKVPFTIDESEFRFTPRVQRVNELEAGTRVKLCFHDRIFKFWFFQGVLIRYPRSDGKLIDLYQLHQITIEEGGFEFCTLYKKWPHIASLMGLSKNSTSLLRNCYEKYLYPYDVFLSGATFGPDSQLSTPEKPNNRSSDSTSPERGELKKIKTFSAGPRMPTADGNVFIQKSQKICNVCEDSTLPSSMLTCDKCANSFHKNCLFPQFTENPRERWHCHGCISKLLSKAPQAYTKEFGFNQSKQTYTLNQFREMANHFKRDYFNCPPSEVPMPVVEKEFWRLASSCDEFVNVEYGADLHTNDYGSGFPTNQTKDLMDSDKPYIDHPWNLNNLPTSDLSVFKHINTNINGMIIPWMYVGMCFSAFCWHNEDHWTYSINYLHWGEPKTWYGVPGDKAEVFEDAMKKIAPELFSPQPDLLHQLTTTCNPNYLQQQNVEIYKANQEAGQFVVTFPRSYHAGFNQGLNFAEAVNFAPLDWLNIGRQSIAHYASLHRYPVFSHDELICKMADAPEALEMRLAEATFHDLITMIECEKVLRIEILNLGITNTQRMFLENLQDDERQCDHCKTTSFLSALRCLCEDKKDKLVCLYHHDHLCSKCSPDNFTLVFRYTLDELKIMIKNLSNHINEFKDWAKKIQNGCNVDRNADEIVPSLEDLKQLADEGKAKNYSLYTDQFELLNITIEEANKCSTHAKSLINFYRNGKNVKQKIDYEKLHLFVDKLKKLTCLIPEFEELHDVYLKAKYVVSTIIDLTETRKEDKANKLREYRKMMDVVEKLKFVDFSIQLEKVKIDYVEIDWFEKILKLESSNKKYHVSDLEDLIEIGLKIPSSTTKIVRKIRELKTMVNQCTTWLDAVNLALNIRDDKPPKDFVFVKPTFEQLEQYHQQMQTSDDLKKMNLEPTCNTLIHVIAQAKKWNEHATSLYTSIEISHSADDLPQLKVVEDLLERSKNIDCKLDLVDYFEDCVHRTRQWIDSLGDAMLDSNFKFYKPVDAVTPRNLEVTKSFTARNYNLMLSKKAHTKDNLFEQKLKGDFSTDKIRELYGLFVNRESVFFEMLRENNMEKRTFFELLAQNDPEAGSFAKKFCVCGKDSKDHVMECQLCLEWYHVGCIQPAQSDKVIKKPDKIDSNKLYLCSLCTKGKRLKIKEVDQFLQELRKLPVRFVEGELLKLLKERVDLWIERLHQELQTYPELKQIYSNQSHDFDLINDEIRTILEDLLFQVFILGVDTDEVRKLWKIFLAVNQGRKTTLFFGGFEKKRRHPSGSGAPAAAKRVKKSNSNNTINSTPKKKEEEDDEDDDDDDDPCAMGEVCKRPHRKPIDWVLCEKCDQWYHQVCQGIASAAEIENISFYCHLCRPSQSTALTEDVSIVTM